MLGCRGDSPAANVDIPAARAKYVAAVEPADPRTATELGGAGEPFSEGEVTLVGRIGGMPNPWEGAEANFPWREGEASFFLVDPAVVAEFAGHEHASGEDDADCVFCQSRAADSVHAVTAVSFKGPDGKPLPIDARKLFDLHDNDTVVVRGSAKRINGGLLVLEAEEIFVRD